MVWGAAKMSNQLEHCLVYMLLTLLLSDKVLLAGLFLAIGVL